MPKVCIFGDEPPEITYLGTGSGPFDIGPERSDRLLVTFCQLESDVANIINSITIGGVAATIDYNATMADPWAVGHAVVPTGTTASVSSNIGGAYATYMITGLVNNAKYNDDATSASGGTCTQTIDTPDGFSAIICGSHSRASNTGYTVSSSGPTMTTDYSANSGGGSNPSHSAGHGIAEQQYTGLTVTESGSAYSSGVGWAGCFH